MIDQNGCATDRPYADWRRVVAPHVETSAARSLAQLASTLALLGLALVAMHALQPRAPLLALLLTLPTAGLLVRTFVIMHDCAHGSFLRWRRGNDVVGFLTGVLTLTPFGQWRRDHALHHASSGDLSRRGHGDIPTLTVAEYLRLTSRRRFAYRVLRHPVTLLLGGPLHLMIGQRLRRRGPATGSRQLASVWSTNVAIAVAVTLAIAALGWRSVVLLYFPAYYLAAMAGVWLFYVQHQFEEAYWEPAERWDYATAALRGSSHLRLPALLQWFTGSIGLHHVHHLAPRIPNYRLQRCHDAHAMFEMAPSITLRSATGALRLALWDEESRRLVGFAALRAAAHPAPGGDGA